MKWRGVRTMRRGDEIDAGAKVGGRAGVCGAEVRALRWRERPTRRQEPATGCEQPSEMHGLC